MSCPPENEGSFWSLFQKQEETEGDGAPSVWSLFAKEPDPEPPESDPEPEPCATLPHPAFMYWAMRDMPVTEAVKHMLVCGCVGSGKTTAIRLFLQSIAPRFVPGSPFPQQLIVFDAKGDMVSMLASMGLRHDADNVWILNPIDPRSAVWNVAEAVQTPAMARAFAALLVPEERQSTAPYFAQSAQELAYAAMLGLNAVAGANWSLRDLLCALDSLEHIKAVTRHHAGAKRLAERFLKDTQHSPSIISTLASKLGRFEQVAALWHTHKSEHQFRIIGTRDNPGFLESPGVLVLGNDPVLRESFWPLNAILLKALVHQVLRQPEVEGPRFWFVLDEFRAMERVDCIHELLNRGRSKGAAVLLGLQSIEGLVEVYGENVANDILSQCATKMFLRAGGPKTAEWAETFFGKIRQMEAAYSETESWGAGSSKSVQYALQDRAMFLASYFLNLPLPVPGRAYTAVCDVPWLQTTRVTTRNFDTLLGWLRRDEQVGTVFPRESAEAQTLWPWSAEEELRFCGPVTDLPAEDDSQQSQLPPRHQWS